MKWQIPAKTFLLGEYAAIANASAIVLTTSPCFQLDMHKGSSNSTIHRESPAGKWWLQQKLPLKQLLWHDPYQGKGGLGASSAQFLGAYAAAHYLKKESFTLNQLLKAYFASAWEGEGLKPSGYDLIAQSQHHCVYINYKNNTVQSYDWVFEDISFLLMHTGKKLPTHTHLQQLSLPSSITKLASLSEKAKKAFENTNSLELIEAINAYQQQLEVDGLIALHSLLAIKELQKMPEVAAIKGCGALGADVLLLIIPSLLIHKTLLNLKEKGWTILATSNDLYRQEALIKIISENT